jgi:hypothetical protein
MNGADVQCLLVDQAAPVEADSWSDSAGAAHVYTLAGIIRYKAWPLATSSQDRWGGRPRPWPAQRFAR